MTCSQTVSYCAGIGICRHDSGCTQTCSQTSFVTGGTHSCRQRGRLDADLLGDGPGDGRDADVAPHLARRWRPGAAAPPGSQGACAHGAQGSEVRYGCTGVARRRRARRPAGHRRGSVGARAARQDQNGDQAQGHFRQIHESSSDRGSGNPTPGPRKHSGLDRAADAEVAQSLGIGPFRTTAAPNDSPGGRNVAGTGRLPSEGSHRPDESSRYPARGPGSRKTMWVVPGPGLEPGRAVRPTRPST